ncbi:hypothetical protein [Ruegeria atlantica]|uniref:hypothetical protein n=1 Tax=Ruegeria atlantica TaxID=81569 RepID=UPI0024955238|nr:hypothetical protein [Ruegeria atlantica]
MADLDAALVQKIFNIAKRKRKPNIHHDGQTDDLGARLEVAKRAASCHPATLSARPTRLNKFLLTVPESALFDAVQVCGVFNLVNRLVEGTGISKVARDPETIDVETVAKLTSTSFYTDFGRANGLDV